MSVFVDGVEHKPIPSLNNEYFIDEFGNVVKLVDDEPREIVPTILFIRRQFYKVVINAYLKDGARRYCSVARLVAEVYMPDFDPSKYVYHKDGDATDNHISNLYQKC